MLWGGICWRRLVPPVIFHNNGVGRGRGVTARHYVDEVLQPVLVPFMAVRRGMVFNRTTLHPTARVGRRTSCIVTTLLQWTGLL